MSHVSNNISWTTPRNGEDITSNSIGSAGSTRHSCRVPTPYRNDEAISRVLQDEEDLTLKDEVKDDSFIAKVVYEDEKKAQDQEIVDELTTAAIYMEEFPYGVRLAALTWLYEHKDECNILHFDHAKNH